MWQYYISAIYYWHVCNSADGNIWFVESSSGRIMHVDAASYLINRNKEERLATTSAWRGVDWCPGRMLFQVIPYLPQALLFFTRNTIKASWIVWKVPSLQGWKLYLEIDSVAAHIVSSRIYYYARSLVSLALASTVDPDILYVPVLWPWCKSIFTASTIWSSRIRYVSSAQHNSLPFRSTTQTCDNPWGRWISSSTKE